MKFSSDRYVPVKQGNILLEHYHRYAVLLSLVRDKVVLDIASGEGYGSSLMAESAFSVTCIDLSEEAANHAGITNGKLNLSFIQGGVTSLKFPDASFDIVVSFVTIENKFEQELILTEIRRVLRKDGILVISSLNHPIYSEESSTNNYLHVKELEFKEFDGLIKTNFPNVHYFGQRILKGSVIQPLGGGQEALRAWHDDSKYLNPKTGSLKNSECFFAICAAGQVCLPSIDRSVLFPDQLDLIKHYVGFAKWGQNLDLVPSERDSQSTRLAQSVDELDNQIIRLKQSFSELAIQVTNLNQIIAERDEQIASLT